MAPGEARFEALVLHSTDLAVVFDSDGTICYVTPSVEAVSGYRVDELLGTTGLDFVHPDDLAADMHDVVQAMAVGATITREWRICRADGSWRWYEFTLTDLPEDPAIRGTVAHFRDVTDRHEADVARRETEGLLRRTVELTSDGFLAIGSDGRITSWNPAAAQLFGWTAEEALGREVSELIVPEEERDLYLDRFRRAVAEDMPRLLEVPFEMITVDRAGRRFPVEVHVVQVDLGGRAQFQAFVRDIGARKEIESQLADYGFTDRLTKLPNRALLDDRITVALARLARRSTTMAVLLVDLDGIQAVRDSLGDVAADQLMVRVAQGLCGTMRASDTVARCSADEFVLVAEDVPGLSEAVLIANRALDAVEAAVALDNHELEPIVRMGIALTSSSNVSAHNVLRHAEAAVLRVKRNGSERFAFYEEPAASSS